MEQTQFWGLNKKLTWMKMQMQDLNSSLVFGAIMSALKQEFQAEVEHQNMRDCGLEVIIDDIALLNILLAIILYYFEVFL